jgi:hypothetical protein
MDISKAINDLITQAEFGTFYNFSLTRTFLPYQPGPVYAVTDHVQGAMQLKMTSGNGEIPLLTAAYLHWAPHSNYLNWFSDMELAEGGVWFGYQSSSGPVTTELVGLDGGYPFGSTDNLLIWGHEEQQWGSYQIGLPSQEVLWIYKFVLDPKKLHLGQQLQEVAP